MTTTYRTDWVSPNDPHGNVVDVSHHDGDLKAARATARKMSKRTGSAYVIKSVGGVDVAHLPHTDGHADPHGWQAD